MSYTLLSAIGLIGASAIALLFCMAGLIRNRWVYRVRMGLIEADWDAYQRMPSYELMMRKWWIWDGVRFIDMPDDTEARKKAKHRAFGKRILAKRNAQ